MKSLIATSAFVSLFQVFSSNDKAPEQPVPEQSVPAIVQSTEVQPIACQVNINNVDDHRDITITATAGTVSVQDKAQFKLELVGSNTQIMRGVASLALEPSEAMVLANYSVTTDDQPTITASMNVAGEDIPCTLNAPSPVEQFAERQEPSQDGTSLACEVKVDRESTRQDIRITATAGATLIQDKALLTLGLYGVNSQTLRRGIELDLQPGESTVLAQYSLSTNDQPTMKAELALSDKILPCSLI